MLVPKRFRRRNKVHKDVSELPVTFSGEELLRLRGGAGTAADHYAAAVVVFATAAALKIEGDEDYYWKKFKGAHKMKERSTRKKEFDKIRLEARKIVHNETNADPQRLREKAKNFVEAYMRGAKTS